MLDEPRGPDVLASVTQWLREQLLPQLPAGLKFQATVAANALDLAHREWTRAPAAERAERDRLAALLGRDGELPDLNHALCEAIADGSIDIGNPGLHAHLWASTMFKMAVDQPRYALYLDELTRRDADGVPHDTTASTETR